MAIAAVVLTPAILLRVTPAFADEPVIARRLLVIAPTTPASPPARIASPVTPMAASAPAARTVEGVAAAPAPTTGKPVTSAEVVAAVEPASPPTAPPLPATPLPPAPPAPPAASMSDAETGGLDTPGRYREIVRRAVGQALEAEKVMESDEIRRTLSELRTSEGDLARADRARIHAEVAAAMAELDQVKARLRSPEFREAIAQAARQAARAAVEPHGAGEKD
jgi:hypothetical protein